VYHSHWLRDELGAARSVAAELLRFAEEKGDGAARILGHRALGATLSTLGEFTAARAHLQQLLALDCPAARHFPFPLPYDPYVSGRALLSLTLGILGYPEQALEHADEALAEAGRLQHNNTLSMVLTLRCTLGQILRDDDDVARHAEALISIAVEQDFAYWASIGAYYRGWVRARAGEVTAGIGEMRRALAACQTTGAQTNMPHYLAMLADTYRRANDVLQGRKLLDEALDRLRRTDARYWEAELLRLDGELRLVMSPPDQDGAEASFRRAIAVARWQAAKAFELRAAMSLARLWVDSGKRCQAHDLLAPIYGWFTEGFTTKHLVESKHLISSLVD